MVPKNKIFAWYSIKIVGKFRYRAHQSSQHDLQYRPTQRILMLGAQFIKLMAIRLAGIAPSGAETRDQPWCVVQLLCDCV